MNASVRRTVESNQKLDGIEIPKKFEMSTPRLLTLIFYGLIFFGLVVIPPSNEWFDRFGTKFELPIDIFAFWDFEVSEEDMGEVSLFLTLISILHIIQTFDWNTLFEIVAEKIKKKLGYKNSEENTNNEIDD